MKIFSLLFLFFPLTLNAADRSDTEIGLSFGTPGAINLVVKKELLGHPLQLTAGYVGSMYGIEGGYRFYYDSSRFMRSWQITVGAARYEDQRRVIAYEQGQYVLRYEDDSWRYIGLSGTFQYGGFFVEPGLSVGSGDYSNPQLMLHAGWLWGL